MRVIRTAEVRKGTLEQIIRLTGSTAAKDGALLRAPYMRGRRSRGSPGDFQLVLTHLADSGSTVRQGDVVAVFDNVNMRIRLDDVGSERRDLESQIERLRANQHAARVAHEQNVRSAKANVETARLDLQTAPVRSSIQVSLFQLALEQAQATYRALQQQTEDFDSSQAAAMRGLELEAAATAVEEQRAAANLERMTVRAPISGLLIMQEVSRASEMAEVRAGDQLRPGQPYLQIVDTRSLVVEAAVNQADVMKLQTGARVYVHLDAYPDVEIPGRLRSVGPIARGASRRLNYVSEVPVKITLDRTDPVVLPRLTVNADVVLASESDVTIIPREAIFYDADGEQAHAYVQSDSGFEKRELELGIANNISAAVRSGVSEGDTVATEQP